MYQLINFEKCPASSVRNVNSKFLSASCRDQFINLFIKMNNITERFELPTEVTEENHILCYSFIHSFIYLVFQRSTQVDIELVIV